MWIDHSARASVIMEQAEMVCDREDCYGKLCIKRSAFIREAITSALFAVERETRERTIRSLDSGDHLR